MVAKEERAYGEYAKKTTEAEERTWLLKNLLTNGVGLREVEKFVLQEEK